MKKLIAVLLTAALVLSLVPFSAFAHVVTSIPFVDEVTSISFAPASEDEYVFYENNDGELGVDYAENEYFWYHLNFHEGDTLTVNYSDGSSKVFVGQFDNGIQFVGDDSVLRSWDDVNIRHDQEHEKWQPGNSYTFYVQYGGQEAPVTASVIANPVDEIYYITARPIIQYAETNGEFRTDVNGERYFHYWVGGYSQNDKLTVVYNDGRGTVDYYCEFDPEWRFASEDGQYIYPDMIESFDNQFNEPFTVGGVNQYYIRYMGHETGVSVSVVENPIKAVVFTPAEPIVIVENTQGDWDTDWEGHEYYRYSTPWFKGGDTLAVTYSETGETVTYTYLYPDGSNPIDRSGFYDVENNYLPIPEQDSVFVSHEGQWELGDNNYMYATYMGNKSGLVKVSIIENPYKGIRYTRAKAPVFIEGNTYHDDWDDRDYYQTPGFENGDILTVIDKYDNETDYVFNDSIFGFLSETNEFIDPGNVGIYSHQHDTPWVLGDENAYYVEYMGFEVTLYASVIENPVKAIEYQAQPQVLIEGRDCYTSYDHGEPYLRYVYPSRELGDSLIIIDKEDNRHVYTLVDDEVNGGCYIDAETGDIIQPGDVNVFDEQYQKPWHLGDDNEYYVEYLGHRVTLYASIIENPVVSISFEPLNPSVVYEVADVDWYDSENDTTYYFEPDFEVGDKLTVVETSGETTVYTAERDERNDLVFAADGKAPIMSWQDIWTGSEQYQGEYWHVGDDNVYFVEYMGRRCYLACELRLNPVGSIEFIPANPAVYVEGTHCYYDFWDDINYYEIPNFEEGDVLRVTYNDATVGTVDYTAEYDLKTDSIRFVSESGDVIETRENKYLRLESNQFIEQWDVGDNTYNVKYFGASAPVTVRIISLGYTSLEYVPAGGTPQVYECYSHPVYDEEGHEYREYAIPDFREGDVIRLYKEEGGYDDYVLVFNTEDGERYFVGENYTFHEYEVYRDCDQIANPWTIGGDNYFDIELFSLKARVRVELIDTDVACVDFIKESPVIEECTGGEYLRDFNGELFYFYNVPSAEPGDIIRVTYKDNSVVDYVVKHDYDEALGIDTWYAASGDGRELTDDDARIFDRQYDEHWAPGKENKIYVLVHGVEAYINVIINHCFIDYVDEKYLVSEADGEKPAVFYYSCLHCGEASENTFEFGGSSSHGGDYTGGDEPTDHDHNLYEGWASNSICHWHVCTLCAHQIEREFHTASDWIIDADATAQAEGHKHIECTVCGYVLAEEVIPRLAAYIPGDINNDGDVNNKDLTRLFQYLSEWDVTVNEAALDVNGDGDVNNKDLTRLFQYLSEWDVVIH